MTTTVEEHTEVSKPGTDLLSFDDFLRWEEASRDTIDVKKVYIDLAGDLATGILLSQIIYWHLPSKGKSKLRVEREGKLWLAKGRAAWWEECRITARQFDRSIQVLRDKGLLETRIFKFKGFPTLHVWLNRPALVEGVKTFLPKGEKPFYPKVKNHIDQTSKTNNIDYLTKTTNIDHKDGDDEGDNHRPAAAVIAFFQESMKIEINPVMEGELDDLVKKFSPERVKAAIKDAAGRGDDVKQPLPYIRKSLENEKEKEKRSAKEKEKKPADGKFHFDHAPYVELTAKEVLDLVDRFGSGGGRGSAEARITDISLYKASIGKTYESDYAEILLWDRRGNPDNTSWDPESSGWNIVPAWLDKLQQKAAGAPRGCKCPRCEFVAGNAGGLGNHMKAHERCDGK